MEFKFEEYTVSNKRFSDVISVTNSFTIGFPQGFYSKNKIGDYNFVKLFYDKEHKAVAIKFIALEDTNSIKIIHSKKYGAHISARNFFKSYDIDVNKYKGKYKYKILNDLNLGLIHIIELSEKENTNDSMEIKS